jgi:maleylacetate reductase
MTGALALLAGTNVVQRLYDLAGDLGATVAMKGIGMNNAELDRAAKLATQSRYHNPRPINRTNIRKLPDDAFQGRRPN